MLGGRFTYLSLFSLVEGGVELLESSQEPDVHSGQREDDSQKEKDHIVEAEEFC